MNSNFMNGFADEMVKVSATGAAEMYKQHGGPGSTNRARDRNPGNAALVDTFQQRRQQKKGTVQAKKMGLDKKPGDDTPLDPYSRKNRVAADRAGSDDIMKRMSTTNKKMRNASADGKAGRPTPSGDDLKKEMAGTSSKIKQYQSESKARRIAGGADPKDIDELKSKSKSKPKPKAGKTRFADMSPEAIAKDFSDAKKARGKKPAGEKTTKWQRHLRAAKKSGTYADAKAGKAAFLARDENKGAQRYSTPGSSPGAGGPSKRVAGKQKQISDAAQGKANSHLGPEAKSSALTPKPKPVGAKPPASPKPQGSPADMIKNVANRVSGGAWGKKYDKGSPTPKPPAPRPPMKTTMGPSPAPNFKDVKNSDFSSPEAAAKFNKLHGRT
jgi:hypothetical protein